MKRPKIILMSLICDVTMIANSTKMAQITQTSVRTWVPCVTGYVILRNNDIRHIGQIECYNIDIRSMSTFRSESSGLLNFLWSRVLPHDERTSVSSNGFISLQWQSSEFRKPILQYCIHVRKKNYEYNRNWVNIPTSKKEKASM